jgi:hypothetical protein
MIYLLRTGRHLFMDKTFQKAHITFQQNFGAYFTGVIFGYIYHNTTNTSVKWTKVINPVIWDLWPDFNMQY